MTTLINIIVFILVLGAIVFVHEFGHFIFAKKNGVYVYEFSIGMGPKLISKKKNETEYSIRLLPIGGFCSLAGEDLEYDKSKKVPKKKQLQNKKWWQRFLILVFGPVNNFIFALIILFIISLIWGSTTMNPVISEVEKDSPSEKAGLEKGDKIMYINNNKVVTSDDITLYLAINNKSYSTFIVQRDENTLIIKVKPEKIEKDGSITYHYGIAFRQKTTKGFINACKYTIKKFLSLFKQMWVTIVALFTGNIKLNQLSGPVGIYEVVGESRKTGGISSILFIMAYLSLNIGFVNLLPIPALDGGHILFILIELIKGSPVDTETENKFHTIGFILLMLLMLVITIKDVITLF